MKKNKHDHKGTKILKLGIFSTLMLAPFMAVLFKCCYVTFNKNAKDSYSGLNQNTQSNIVIHDLTDFDYSKTYYITNSRATNQVTTAQTTGDIFFNTCNIITNSLSNNLPNDIKRVHWYLPANNNILYLYVYDSESNMYSYNSNQNILLEVTIDSIAQANYDNLQSVISNSNALYYIDYFNQQQLDNAFYYAIDEAMDSPYFAWARTSALYTATSGLTNGLGINTQAIPTLLVYWLILTTIYIIFDIVIESFTYLTHMITSRFE